MEKTIKISKNLRITPTGKGGLLIFSYDKLIARIKYNTKNVIVKKTVEINKEFYKYSSTTSRHLSHSLGDNSSKIIDQKIKDGIYKLLTFKNI